MALDYTDNTALRAALEEVKQQVSEARDALAVAAAAVKQNDSIKAQKPLDEAFKAATRNLRLLTTEESNIARAITANEFHADADLPPHPLGESVGLDGDEITFSNYGQVESSMTIDADRAAKLVAALTERFSL